LSLTSSPSSWSRARPHGHWSQARTVSPRRHHLELAPSSQSRTRSVLAPSSMYRARSVVNGLKLALSPPLSNSPQKSSMEKEIERIQRKIVRR
ncbi:unnamed protein product, partial [Brassica rapa subsp. trilocularis]